MNSKYKTNAHVINDVHDGKSWANLKQARSQHAHKLNSRIIFFFGNAQQVPKFDRKFLLFLCFIRFFLFGFWFVQMKM